MLPDGATRSRNRAFLFLVFVVTIVTSAVYLSQRNPVRELDGVEIHEYEGQNFSSIYDFRENSIRGLQYVEKESYRLSLAEAVAQSLELRYDQVLTEYQRYEVVAMLHCVKGWGVTIFWEDVLVKDLLHEVNADPDANTVIFSAYDGYSTSLPLDYLVENDILMAYKMNGVVLPPERGFPFQLVAESKLGYK